MYSFIYLPATSPYANPSTCTTNDDLIYVKKRCISWNKFDAFLIISTVVIKSENENTIVLETPNETEVITDAHNLFGHSAAGFFISLHQLLNSLV